MKERADFSGVSHYTHVDVQPGGINIQHVEHLYQADLLKQLGIELEVKRKTDEQPAVSADDGLVEKLMPIFYNNEADVHQFLVEIHGMATEDITDLVNRWVKDKRISDYGNSRKGDLWSILNSIGLYTKTRQNWCRRVY